MQMNNLRPTMFAYQSTFTFSDHFMQNFVQFITGFQRESTYLHLEYQVQVKLIWSLCGY